MDGPEHPDLLLSVDKLALQALGGGLDVVRGGLESRHLDCLTGLVSASLILLDLVISVRRPESVKEFLLSDEVLLFGIHALEEDLELLVRDAQLEADNGLFELIDRNGDRVVSIDEVEALVDGHVVPHQVGTDLLEDAAFPLLGILGLYNK